MKIVKICECCYYFAENLESFLDSGFVSVDFVNYGLGCSLIKEVTDEWKLLFTVEVSQARVIRPAYVIRLPYMSQFSLSYLKWKNVKNLPRSHNKR